MGVKSLWSLLTPVGRPVMLETIEGKVMAIDSSIWIYQFQATMRDKEGRGLVNAHVLGFLRRISKLLFYGIKPVFVFDGGAPALKKETITERKKKKAGAAASYAKIAEKLLAAQMRREALLRAESDEKKPSSRVAGSSSGTKLSVDDDTVYLEDIDPNAMTRESRPVAQQESKELSPKKPKNKWLDHDQYRLPDVDLNTTVANATRGSAPDPRLATEDELRAFIEEMRPEDFDYTSPAFRELPTEVQYEIIGDLRLKSRQTSYKRLETMLKQTKTPLDFSKQQILHLKQRNELTQQLLMTTDSIGKAHLTIPVRVASERNKQYVLIKNEGKDGGWILGMRDEGTMAQPIELDMNENGKDSDDEMDVVIPGQMDPDLREHMREMALSSIAGRQDSTHKRTAQDKAREKRPLFELDEDEIFIGDEEDEQLSLAIQASLDDRPPPPVVVESSPGAGPSGTHHDGDEDYVIGPSRLQTQLLFANASPKKADGTQVSPPKSTFGRPFLLTTRTTSAEQNVILIKETSSDNSGDATLPVTWQSETIPEIIADGHKLNSETSEDDMEEVLPPGAPARAETSDDDDDMEEVIIPSGPSRSSRSPSLVSLATPSIEETEIVDISARALSPSGPVEGHLEDMGLEHMQNTEQIIPTTPPPTRQLAPAPVVEVSDSDENEPSPWSRSPTPILGDASPPKESKAPVEELDWDAAQEMDPQAEEGEFAQFLSQMKGRDLNTIRKEIDEEIKTLNKQRKNAMRDSEDVTQQMISQIMMMLRLFGIPYMTAPMEAEAQCAELLSLGLVDGVITDDSDVFLFGGSRVYKNMFNQSKTVECFLASDLTRELGLDRDTLIRLAYLLGSDYVDGLPGVGPVIAMELLKEFPGQDGLHKFKDWWTRVQTGKDRAEESSSKFRKRFKKKFKDMYLQPEWPNPAVRDAYYHPTVDSSEEPFKWGLPDLDALRSFFYDELGWQQSKVDELLLPIIQKINKRSEAAALNRQSNLNTFLDISSTSGTHAPRKRKAYTSKRLQQVVSEYRKEQKRAGGQSPSVSPSPGLDAGEEEEEQANKKARKMGREQGGAKGRGRGRGGKGIKRKKKQESVTPSSEVEEEAIEGGGKAEEPVAVAIDRAQLGLRPRPRRIERPTVVDDGEGNE